MKKLAIVSSHPIQYNAPLFQLLATSPKIKPRIYYTWSQAAGGVNFDPGFGKLISWDIPLLQGYDYEFVDNVSNEPGTKKFGGLDNPTLISSIENWKADAVLIFGWNFKSHLACMRHFKGKIPVYFRGDSTLLDEQPGVRRIARRLALRWIYRNIDKAFYVGENNKRYWEVHGLRSRQLIYAPHAIDNARFGDSDFDEEAAKLRKDLGYQENDFVVLFTGKMEVKKNPQYFLKLSAGIDSPDVKFLMVGNGSLEAGLKNAAEKNPRFKFLDFQNQKMMPVIYRAGNLLVMPSVGPGETWGLALNEAMASGRPVAATTKAGGAADLIINEVNGVIFQPSETSKLVEFIKRMTTDVNFYKKACENSKEKIKGFSFAKIVEAIESEF